MNASLRPQRPLEAGLLVCALVLLMSFAAVVSHLVRLAEQASGAAQTARLERGACERRTAAAARRDCRQSVDAGQRSP